ncbi:M20/M25/M40 family metallo-hydrolase [Gryllotalpicola sp.]|uniref:M20/M25/M40 family metallo-hydrolase n=1 Tax=Gryllotalpicola sp. TaxID=1932787 RepID=UPI0026270395|nr:M20/M25/M40 family metallo-hydrolase [Gryllotalpicola sp.]
MAEASVRAGIEERLARMIRAKTVTGEDAELAAFPRLLRELYPLVHERLELERVGELGLLYHWRAGLDAPASAATRPAVLMAHFDVVPVDPDDIWSFDAFGGAISGGIVYGRGAIDDKGALVVLLDAVENLLQRGFTPPRDIYLSFGGDEETYGGGAKTIADLLHARGIRPWIVLDEGGAIVEGVMPMVPEPAAQVGVGEKGILSVELRATGVAGHASTPANDLTATDRIARAVARLTRNPFPDRLNDTGREMLRRYRTRATASGRRRLSLLLAVPTLAAHVFSRLGNEPAAMVHTTLVTTMLGGGTAPNVIPSTASAMLNIRIATGSSVAASLAILRRAVDDPEIELHVVEASEPSPESRTDAEQFALIERAIDAAYPGVLVAPYIMLAASDARHFHRYTPEHTYRFAPLHLDPGELRSVHGVDERVTVSSLVAGEVFYRTLIESL